jgi:hypothetical protein
MKKKTVLNIKYLAVEQIAMDLPRYDGNHLNLTFEEN